MEDKKRLKSELETDAASIEFRAARLGQLSNLCPKCHEPMTYNSGKDFEGWQCRKCGKNVALGKPVPPEKAVDPEERAKKFRRFGDKKPGGCSGC